MMGKIDEHTTVGIAYSLMAKVVRFDKKINEAYCKASEDSSVDFDKTWKVFIKTCNDCIDEFEQIYEKILEAKKEAKKK